MTYLLEHCLLTISSLLHWVHFAASPSGHNTGFYLNVWYILFGWRMCEGPWTSAVLNCSASSQCTRWNFRLPKFCCFVPFPLLQQPPARMHARARDSIKPRLPRFTGVLSQAGAALALKMLLLRFIVLDFNFVLTNARLYLKRKGKKKKRKRKKYEKEYSLLFVPLVICGFTWMWQNKGSLILFGVWNVGDFSFVSVRSFVICSCPLLEQGALRCHDGACLLQSPVLTVGIGLGIWWVLSAWL